MQQNRDFEMVKRSMSEDGKKSLLAIISEELNQMNSALHIASTVDEMFRIQGQVSRLKWMASLFEIK